MQADINLTIEQYHNKTLMKEAVSQQLGLNVSDIVCINELKRSIDCRRHITYRLKVEVVLQGETPPQPPSSVYQDCHAKPPVVIVGGGPAGMFAALRALEVGLRPIVVERGEEVQRRKQSLAAMVRSATVNPNSNWSFGEGGAGTFSDGKLYTRSSKRGDIANVLRKLVEHGANPDILVDSHPHIGTDKLPVIVSAIRETIISHGGEYHFNSRVSGFIIEQQGSEQVVKGVKCNDGTTYEGIATLLCCGHSARDIYMLFHSNGWALEAKPFAVGMRVEHPQRLIDSIQYHSNHPSPLLPPASYSLTTQALDHGVFSFCMCPGGVIVPASTATGEQVVNGMSDSHRSSGFANSGIAVTVGLSDVASSDTLALLMFQQQIEQRACAMGGGALQAPAARLTDFCQGKLSQSISKSNYMGSTVIAPLHELLPKPLTKALQQGLQQFGRMMHGFYTDQATLLAVESRTSSPLRIVRDHTGQHPQLRGLYPCGEGAGYAGGITSSALDGIRAINTISHSE